MMNVLLVDAFPDQFLTALQAMGLDILDQRNASKSDALSYLPQADILIINSKFYLNKDTLNNIEKLKLVCRAGVGMDHFDLTYLFQKNIQVFNTPGANAISVGEQSLGMLLNLMHRISSANAEVKNEQWNRESNRGTELSNKTVGIIGFGNTGNAFAQVIQGFGCRILAHDKYKTDFSNEFVTESSLEDIYQFSDVVSLHIPLNEETRYYANPKFFKAFQKSIWFLNLSRGPVVQTSALIESLEQGKVIAAGLDVLENEKLEELSDKERAEFQYLKDKENVILTPHIGGWSHESLERINNRILAEINRFLQEN